MVRKSNSREEYYLNKENLRGNQGYYSPDIRSKKGSSTYLQNFQKLMGARSGSRNNIISNHEGQHSGNNSPNSHGKRLQAMKRYRNNSGSRDDNLNAYSKKISQNL